MKYFGLFSVLAGLLLVFACRTQTTQPVAVRPAIRTIQGTPIIFSESEGPFYFRVDVFDPQGVSDVSTVRYDVTQAESTILTGTMTDDGQNGDIIAGDGQFTAAFSGAQFSGHTGGVIFAFTAEDREGNVSETVWDTVDVRAAKQNHLPKLLFISAPDSVNLAVDSVFVIEGQLSDPDGLADLLGIQLEMYPAGSLRPVFQDTLRDDGRNGDSTAGDGLVKRTYASNLFQGKRGRYILHLVGLDKSGGQSTPKLKTLFFFGLKHNDPPVLSHVSAPDSVSRSKVNDFVFSVQVTDPQGPEDIAEVYILVTKPDGTPSSGNPFRLNDRGQNGDAVAYDGIYSSGFQIPSSTALGRYIFEVHAVDVSGAQGNIIQHIITVIP